MPLPFAWFLGGSARILVSGICAKREPRNRWASACRVCFRKELERVLCFRGGTLLKVHQSYYRGGKESVLRMVRISGTHFKSRCPRSFPHVAVFALHLQCVSPARSMVLIVCVSAVASPNLGFSRVVSGCGKGI